MCRRLALGDDRPMLTPTPQMTIRSAWSADGERLAEIFCQAFESIAPTHGFPVEPPSREFTRFKSPRDALADPGVSRPHAPRASARAPTPATPHMSERVIRSKLAIVAALRVLLVAAGAVPAAAGKTVTVSTTADDTLVSDGGGCSMREAILVASGLPGGDECRPGPAPGDGEDRGAGRPLRAEPAARSSSSGSAGRSRSRALAPARREPRSTQHASPVLDVLGRLRSPE